MTTPNYAMFTNEGNQLIHRIVLAGQALAKFDDNVWEWAEHELNKLSHAPGYEEATDTAVREAVYSAVSLR